MSFRECTQVTPQCPVEATTYGYYPNLPGNAILLAVFAAVTVAQGILGLFYRLPSFGSVVTIACAGEAIGYGGRIMMNSNPWSDAGFKIQIVCLILSPSFLAAGIYLTLKHVVMAIGPQYSRLKPNLYTWIFISCDAGSILLQAAGGGVASAGDGHIVDVGNSIMIAGIAFQVATMTVCLILAVDFAIALWRGNVLRRTTPESSESEGAELEKTTTNSAKTNKFYYYLTCSFIAFIAIYVRCIYRSVFLQFQESGLACTD